METEIKIGSEVTIDDVHSMNNECTGIVTEVLPYRIYKVTFSDGTFSYHEYQYLHI